MATHSSILAWKIPWTEEPGGYSPWGHKESDTTERFHFHILTYICICNIYVSLQLIHNVVQQKRKQHCKAIILQTENKEGMGFHVTFSVISDLWEEAPFSD